MTWVAAGTAGVGAVTSMMGSDKAADAQDAAAKQAQANTVAQYGRQRRHTAGDRRTGKKAQKQLNTMLGLSGGSTKSKAQIRDDFLTQERYKGQYDTSGGKTREGKLGRDVDARYAELKAAGDRRKGSEDFGSLTRGFSADDFEVDPGYAFRQEQGEQGVNRMASARGNLLSGAGMKEMERFRQGLASQEYGNAYNRFNQDRANKYNVLSNAANVGRGATNQMLGARQVATNQINDFGIQAGNVGAAEHMAQANAFNQGIGAAGGAWQDYKARQGANV